MTTDEAIHDILTDLLVTACEEGVEGHVCNPSDAVYGKALKALQDREDLIRSQSAADGARKERERLDRKVFVVFYRGNGYGPFNNIEIAEAFAKFIPNHNEKKFNTKQYGEYEANIQEWTLGKAIATLRAGMEERKGK